MSNPPRSDQAPSEGGEELQWGSIAACFAVDEFTGASTFNAPLRLSPGRGGLQPEAALQYDSRWGNGPFGLGWRLDPPAISRRTIKEVPRYRDEDDDEFEFQGDELVPALRRSGGAFVEDSFTIGEYLVQRYRRRHEGVHDRIERWLHQPTSQIHWRKVDRNNVTSLFGIAPDCRVSDAADPARTGRWLLAETFDDRGNVVRYKYKAEDLDGVDLEVRNERHRIGRSDAAGGARYLKRIQYGNSQPHDRAKWHFQVVFDYGDHDDEAPGAAESKSWDVRPDPFSNHRLGFEVRQWRRCRRVLQFHSFEELGAEPTLVNATEFSYDSSTGRSLLAAMAHTGYAKLPSGDIDKKTLPAIQLSYNQFRQDESVQTLESDALLNALVDENARAQWVDLHGEGLPGVMSRLGDSWYYLRNLGGGRFAEPEMVVESDVDVKLQEEVLDIDQRVPEATVSHEREYQPTTTFRNTANVNHDDPYIGYLDLNGDSADDVVVADDRIIRWYPSQGEEGFGDPVVLQLEQGEHTRSHRLYADKKQSFHVADMTGDGLYDLVRVRSGEICYWPNQGRGRFGDRVVMSTSPTFPNDEGHVLLVDLDGRWTTDLAWIGEGEIRYWENHSGDCWAGGQRIAAPGISAGAPDVAAIDLTGSGCASLLWVDRSAGVPKIRYVTPASDHRSDMLCTLHNGRGLSVSLSYLSSTEFWLRDRAAGGAWLTALPEPVHMVETIDYIDLPADTRRSLRYAYHHGHYDSDEVRFNGFAYVERWETLGLADGETTTNPVLTRTWRHTGTQFEDADLTAPLKEEFFQDAYLGRRKWLGGNQMPLAQQAKDIPQAHRALRGQLLRQEIYSLDGPPSETVPYQIVERTAWVRQIQPGQASLPPVFDVRENECIEVAYERDTQDPRISHSMTLSLDEWGYTTRSVLIHYGRPQPDHDAQGDHDITVLDSHYLHRGDQPTWYRLGILSETTDWALVGAAGPVSKKLYEVREIKGLLEELPIGRIGPDIQPPHRRLTAKCRCRFWSNDMTQVLPLGKIESLALPARVDRLALTSDLISHALRNEAAEILAAEGGYNSDEDGLWAPGVATSYDPGRFYQPSATTDAFDNVTQLQWTPEGLALQEVADPYGNVAITETNVRTLMPWSHTDVNGNVLARRYDALGMVLSTAVIGKPDLNEADTMVLSSPEPSAHDDPTVVVTYDPHAWTNAGQPTWIRTRMREHHGDDETSIQDSVVFLDGHERVLWTAARTNDDKWTIRDAVQRDGCGRILRKAAPFFSDFPVAEEAVLEQAFAAGYRYEYDALNRLVRTDFPNGTFETAQYRSWSNLRADSSDTVLESDWYARRQHSSSTRAGDFTSTHIAGLQNSARVAALASAYAKTPTIELLDSRGRVCVTRTELSGGALAEDRTVYDAHDNVVARLDRRGSVSMHCAYDLMGRAIRTTTVEGGTVTQLLAADGEVIRFRDAQSRVVRYRYDKCRRRTHTIFLTADGDETVMERFVYGGSEIVNNDAVRLNAVGRLALRLNQAGLDTYAYDFHGSVSHAAHRNLRDHRFSPDWSLLDDASRISDFEATIDGDLETPLSLERLETRYEYDALVRPRRLIGPDASSIEYRYGPNGPTQVGVRQGESEKLLTVADNIRHDAAGRPTSWIMGGGSFKRSFDTEGRELSARVAHNGSLLRDTQILHDALGNVATITDGGELVTALTYDADSMLARAEGLEAVDGNGGTQSYSESYALDSVGNRTMVDHRSADGGWTVSFDYQADNRLRASVSSVDGGDEFKNTYQYDEAGHLIHQPDGSVLRWDVFGNLTEVEIESSGNLYLAYDGKSLVRRVVDRPGGIVDETVISGAFERRRRTENGKVTFEQYVTSVCLDEAPVAVVERTTVPLPGVGANLLVRYQVTDHVGSVVLELDAHGKEITREFYRPFGDSGLRRGHSPIGLATKRYGFLGGRFDADSGFTHLGGRWYAARLGRFIAPVPADVPGNRYVIGAGNPSEPLLIHGDHAWLSAVHCEVLSHYSRLLGGPACLPASFEAGN